MPNCGITCGFDTCTCTSLFEPGEVTGWPSLCDTYRSIFFERWAPKSYPECTFVCCHITTLNITTWQLSPITHRKHTVPLQPHTLPTQLFKMCIKSSEDPSWKRLQTSSRNPVCSGQSMDLTNFQSQALSTLEPFAELLNCRNCI